MDFIQACKIIANKGIKECIVIGHPLYKSEEPFTPDDVKLLGFTNEEFLQMRLPIQLGVMETSNLSLNKGASCSGLAISIDRNKIKSISSKDDYTYTFVTQDKGAETTWNIQINR